MCLWGLNTPQTHRDMRASYGCDSPWQGTAARAHSGKEKYATPHDAYPGGCAHLDGQVCAGPCGRAISKEYFEVSARMLCDHLLGDGLQLHVGGAFVDGTDLGIAVELFRRELLGEADTTEELDGF